MQTTVPTPDDVVAVSNLLDQMTSLLEMEQSMLESLQAQDGLEYEAEEQISMDPLPQVKRGFPGKYMITNLAMISFLFCIFGLMTCIFPTNPAFRMSC